MNQFTTSTLLSVIIGSLILVVGCGDESSGPPDTGRAPETCVLEGPLMLDETPVLTDMEQGWSKWGLVQSTQSWLYHKSGKIYRIGSSGEVLFEADTIADASLNRLSNGVAIWRDEEVVVVEDTDTLTTFELPYRVSVVVSIHGGHLALPGDSVYQGDALVLHGDGSSTPTEWPYFSRSVNWAWALPSVDTNSTDLLLIDAPTSRPTGTQAQDYARVVRLDDTGLTEVDELGLGTFVESVSDAVNVSADGVVSIAGYGGQANALTVVSLQADILTYTSVEELPRPHNDLGWPRIKSSSNGRFAYADETAIYVYELLPSGELLTVSTESLPAGEAVAVIQLSEDGQTTSLRYSNLSCEE